MTVSYSPLPPVSAAVFTALNVAALLAIAVGGVVDASQLGTATRPYVFFEVSNPTQLGGFGTWPGHGDVPKLELRVHAISDQPNVSESQAVLALCVQLLYQVGALSVSGYTVCANQPMTDIQRLNLGDQLIAGVVVHEEVAIIPLIVENTSV